MADEVINTRIVADADFSNLIADVHKVTASLSKLQEQLASSNKMLANQISVMNRSFSDTIRSTGQFSTHFVSLQSDVEKFGKNLDGGKLKLNQYFNTFRDHARTSGGVVRDLAKQQVSLQNAILQPLGKNTQGLMQFNVHVPRGLDVIKNKAAIARQELQIMNRVMQDGAGQLINWGKNTQWAGRQLTVGLTVPLAAFGKAAADAFKQADMELTRLTKVYGDVAGTSAEELGKVRKEVSATAKELASAMGVNFKETIGLAADIAATGKTGDELLGSIKETTRLAVLGEVDRQDAMKATLAIQTAFKQNTEELSESINFLNAVENQTSTTLNDLVEAIPKAGPVIKGLGGDVQDLALYLTAMREGGINASEGANALKSGLASLINPTKQSVGMLSEFGIDILGIVNKNAGETTNLLLDLQGALDSLDPLSKARAIEQLFGKFQFARISALLNNLGREGSQTLQVMDLMSASSQELADVAGRELSAVTESASGRYRRAMESLKADLAGLGENFLNIGTKIANILSGILDFAQKLPDPIKKLMTFAGAFTAILGPVIMLTGVLANFFGYILKGVGHMRMFFKGGEGWKYLTPEMLAAEKAGRLVEQSFYSDAKAAAVLKQALGNLIDEFSILEAKAKSGALAVNPAVSTMAGNLVVAAGGPRVVNPNHPLAGAMGTRASSHMVPRAGMTDDQRLQQTMFGMVPGSSPVNQKIGQNPQIYMNDALPNVPGLTTVGGVSTGIVSGEAAKWHSMMATLAMQSKAEIEMLKKTIVATGTVNKEFMMQFDDILPLVSRITDNAARESALIVAELRAGKLTVESAKAKIIALNLETERMITSAVTTQAAAMGRTINPTMVPTLNQPVVDPLGKSNMRELFKKGKTRDFINKIAGTLGVRTSGAGYNIETTIPRRLAMGEVGVKKYAGGYTSIAAAMKASKMLREFSNESSMIGGLRKIGSRSNRVGAEAGVDKSFGEIYRRGSAIYKDPEFKAYGITPTSGNDYLVHAMTPGFRKRTAGLTKQGSSSILSRDKYSDFNLNMDAKTLANNSALQLLPTQFIKNTRSFNTALSRGGNAAMSFRPVAGDDMVSLLMFLKSQGLKPAQAKVIANRAAQVLNHKISTHKGPITEAVFGKLLNNASVRAIQSGAKPNMVSRTNAFGSDKFARNMGASGIDLKENSPFGTPGFKDGVTNLSGYGGGDIIPALLEPGESVVTKTATRGNAGTLALMNKGFPIDSILGFEEGVVGAESSKSSRGGGMGGMGYFMGGMGMQMAGGAIGGTAGSIMGNVGMAMQFMPMLGMLPKLKGGTSLLTGAVKLLTNGIKAAAVAMKAFALNNPILLAGTAAVAGAIFVFKKWRKEIEETKREQTNLFGITEKGAKEAGIQYVSLTDKIKLLREEQKLAADKARAYFESYNASGVKGLTLTIQQLKELKTRVKTDMPDLISTFNSIDASKINDLAANLKAQMVAGGKSVEEATNLIYALVEASDKAGMGVSAISTKAFAGITDKGSAASFVLKSLAKNIEDVNSIDASAFASNVDSAIGSLDSAVSSLIGTKDESGKILDEAGAIAVQFEKMVTSGVKNNRLGEEALKTLKSQRPEFASVLNKSETIGGMYAKWRLTLAGVKIDLSKISSAQAETLASFEAGLQRAADTATVLGNSLSGVSSVAPALKKVTDLQKAAAAAAEKGAKQTAGLSKEAIKAIQDEIKAIRDRAEAKKRALRETFDQENAELELQQAKLDLQSAVARGDNEATAAAQIRIKQIQNESSLKASEARIDENARKAEAAQQKKLDADAVAKEKASINANSNQKAADRFGGSAEAINSFTNQLTTLASSLSMLNTKDPGYKAEEAEIKMSLSNIIRNIAKSANSDKFVAEAFSNYLEKDSGGKFIAKEEKTYNFPKQGKVTMGGAFDDFTALSKSMSGFAIKITGAGGKTLSHIYDILAKGESKTKTITVEDLEKALSSGKYKQFIDAADLKSGLFKKDGTGLKDDARELAIRLAKLEAGDQFSVAGTTYNVKSGASSVLKIPKAVRKSMGGYISRAASGISGMSSSQPYLVGERGPELFVPSSGGQIIPNGLLGASYNIPGGSISGISGMSGGSSSSNTYNIDIQLSGTNVTADDIMRKFKSELALVNAKEGRSRSFGGNY